MDKPHAAKGWREFLVELSTIVIGILIALGLSKPSTAHEKEARRPRRARPSGPR
jgi:hypothetical protein